MKIDTSTVQLSASHAASIREEVRETVRAWVGNQPSEAEGNGTASSVVALSAAARDAAMRAAASMAPAVATDAHATGASSRPDSDLLPNLIRLVVEALTGIKVRALSQEDMPMLAGNNGYLVLDLNGNGTIDSGKEPLGRATGNGFAELAQYDSDGNGWIDENDPVFQQLGVWKPGASLQSLKDSNVGALHTGSVASPFELKDADQSLLGAVRSSGIYLTEDGKAGSLQQIDVVI